MPLDYHLDRAVKLSEDSKHKGLYNWSLQEFDGEAQKGPDYIPWSWTLHFTATEVTYRQQLALGERYRWAGPAKDQSEAIEKPAGFVEREHIRAVLRPGYAAEDPRWATTLSMFGTGRAIGDIALWVYPAEDDADTEKCVVRGGLSYTTDIDFRDETQPDYLHFYVNVTRARFADLKARVKSGDFDFVTVTVNRVEGFYSEWSPGISTSRVKVLTKAEDHKLERADDAQIEPRGLGGVDEFDLSFITDRKPRLPVFKNEDEEYAEPDYDAIDPVEQERARAAQLPRLVAGLEDKAKKAQIALWVIAGLLVLALLK